MTDGTLLAGKRGAGKSLIAVARIREYMWAGRMVATNLNLRVEYLVPPRNKVRPFRVPDWPTASDLMMLPLGNPGLEWREGEKYPVMREGYPFSEEENGLLVLDELATFLNSRDWQGKDRQELINWLLHSRKFGWDLLFISQHVGLVDKQVRDALFDLYATTRRLDKVQVPVLGRIAAIMGFKLRLPKLHVAHVRYGMQPGAPLSETIWVRGHDLYRAYDTTQKINPETGVKTGEGFQYLSAWDLRGRYMSWWEMNKKAVLLFVSLGVLLGVLGDRFVMSRTPKPETVVAAPAEDKFATGITATGFYRDGGLYRIVLSDGRAVVADQFRETASGWQAKVGELWYRGEQR
ncbi:zonular occludens toxin domain-containing protein [Ralstonia mannitolilytica]|uniref:zonular occludens toxin domain-containing protein n=1 Tax=Ralstonia mannitolilytica TaxID=105219 RepID=UPI002930A376|nr:zonular occludens toxin domain-containing protein [Ralstonia mannitolilytica]